MIKHFPKHIVTPAVLVENKQFMVKLAENHEEVEKAQRLRYEIFNVEQGRGLDTAEKYGIDFDEFDEYCLHLLVMDKESDRVIGTYRAHLGCIANSAKGFYSSREYDIRGLYGIADKCLELGRSCVSPEYRTGIVVGLLWGAITELLHRADLIYMLGCVSLEERDPRIGWALYEYIKQTYSVCNEFRVSPRPGFILRRPSQHEINRTLEDKAALKKHIPPIFKGYLHLGARICGDPAMDKEFGTIDFFIFVNVTKVPERYLRHFKYKQKNS
jgi:putative hemolysin